MNGTIHRKLVDGRMSPNEVFKAIRENVDLGPETSRGLTQSNIGMLQCVSTELIGQRVDIPQKRQAD